MLLQGSLNSAPTRILTLVEFVALRGDEEDEGEEEGEEKEAISDEDKASDLV